MDPRDSDPAERAPDVRLIALLGVALALVLCSAGDGLLMPQIESTGPRTLALLTIAAGFSFATWLSARTRYAPRLAAAALVLGGLLSSTIQPLLQPANVQRLIVDDGLTYYARIVLLTALIALPIVLPLGALTQWEFGDGSARARWAWLIGLGAGFAVVPWLTQVQLGHANTLAAAGLIAAAAALTARGAPSSASSGARLAPGAALDLVLLGGALSLVAQSLGSYVDLGDLPVYVWATTLCVGALIGQILGPRRLPRELILPAALLFPLLFAEVSQLRDLAEPGSLPDLLRLALAGLPLGIALGARLSPAPAGALPWLAAPGLLALSAALVFGFLLSAVSASALSLGIAVLGTLALFLRAPRPRPVPLALGLGLGLAALLLHVPRPGDFHIGGAASSWTSARLPDGTVSYDTNGPGLALDGRLTRAWSSARHRRLVSLPTLLHGRVGGALLVSADRGEAAEALLRHGDVTTHWLRPFAEPPLERDWPEHLQEVVSEERSFLAAGSASYDLILLLPDPRVRARMARVSTVEFYKAADRRLLDEGLFCQWWDVAAVDISDVKAAMASAQLAFPYVYLLIDHPRARRGLVGIVGRRQPLQVWPTTVDENLAAHAEIGADFARDGLDGLLAACLVVQDTQQLRLLAPPELALHDARPTLGLRGGLRPLPQPETLESGLAARGLNAVDPMGWIRVEPEQIDDVSAHVRDIRRGWTALIGAARLTVIEHGADFSTPELGFEPRLLDYDEEPLGTGLAQEAEALALALATLPDWEYLERLVGEWAQGLEQHGEPAQAELLLRRAIDLYDPSSAPLRFALANIVERKGDLADALELYGTALAFDAEHAEADAAVRRLSEN